MNFEVHFSSAAQADIDQIFDYISVTGGFLWNL